MPRIFLPMIYCLAFFVTSLQASELVELKACIPKIICTQDKIYVHHLVASRLKRVQEDLAKLGLGIVVYDGYRSPSLDPFPDNYNYTKGMGIDLSIYYLNGCHLAMPTEYGDESDHARRDCVEWPAHVFHNCWILEKAMGDHGFEPTTENWWHFNLKGWNYQEDLYSPNCNDLVYRKFTP